MNLKKKKTRSRTDLLSVGNITGLYHQVQMERKPLTDY